MTDVRELVRERSGGFCEARLEGCNGRAVHLHHRQRRSQRGADIPENLLHVCASCHDAVHRIGERAYRLGLLVRSSDDPAAVPVLETLDEDDASAVTPGDVCPACNRRVPVPREDRTPRKRQQVNISVPADAEDGADVLKGLIDGCRERLAAPLGYDASTPTYYVLAAVLADWLGSAS